MSDRRGGAWVWVCAVLATAAVEAGPPDPGWVRSPALQVEVQFPKKPKLYRNGAHYGNGYCRSYHYALTIGKDASEREFDLMVLQHARLKGTAEEVLERFAQSQLKYDKKTVLDKKLVEVRGQKGIRMTFRTEATKYRGAVETRAQYVLVGKTIYKLAYTTPVGTADSDRRWLLLRASFKITPQAVSHAWLPHVSGRGAFTALFPKRPKESEETTEVDGAKVPQARVALDGTDTSLWITSHKADAALSTDERKQRNRARKALFAATQAQATSGLTEAVVRKNRRVSSRCRELVLAGKLDGKPALRVWRTTVRRGRILIASATRLGQQTPQEVLEAFVRNARLVPQYGKDDLSRASSGGRLGGATLGTGEKLKGHGGPVGKEALRVFNWSMPRAEFRSPAADYLARPALVEYSRSWVLHKQREAKLQPRSGGSGVARTYYTRDADDIVAIHERLVIDPKGYRGKSIVLRNAAVDPKHLTDLFAD